MPRRIAIGKPIVLAAILASGFALVWAVLLGWGFQVAKDYFGSEQVYENVEFRMDGTPVVRIGKGKYGENNTYRTLDGKPLAISRQEAWLYAAYLAGSSKGPSYGLPWFSGNRWNEGMVGYNDGGQPMTYWYFLHAAEPSRSGYFIGFDSISKQRVGYIGRKGFRTDMPVAEERFPMHHNKSGRGVIGSYYSMQGQEPHWSYSSEGPGRFPSWMVYLLTDDGIEEVDLLRRSTRVVLKESGLISASQVYRGLSSPITRDSPAYVAQLKEFLAVRTKDHVLILDSSGKQISSFVIPTDLAEVTFGFHFLSDQSAILAVTAETLRRLMPEKGDKSRLLWIDTAGKTSREITYSLKGFDFIGQQRFSPWHVSWVAPAPLAVAAVAMVLQPWLDISWDEEPTIPRALGRSFSEFWPALVVVCLFGDLLAWLCYRRQQRYGLPWTKTWLVFVFLTGFPGLVAYYAHRRWPALEKCPACDQPAPRDRDACFACGQEFPTPAPKGIEVFA
jgi:hypothetical protein